MVAEFRRSYIFKKKIRSVKLRFSGDTEYQLFMNGEIIATGPVSVGGDFLENERPRDNFYSSQLELFPNSTKLDFFARVRLMPVMICEYSKGHGGFMLTGHVTFEDGTCTILTTDERWQVRKNGAYYAPFAYDSRIQPEEWMSAEYTDNRWQTIDASIPVREEWECTPIEDKWIYLSPGERREISLEFDRIYAGFVHVQARTNGVLKVQIHCRELEEKGSHEKLIFLGNGEYRGFGLHSVGNYMLMLENESTEESAVRADLIATHYPVTQTAVTFTNDEEMNRVLEVCRHTLKYCRQLHHLDSPRHCEPLACTGDYYIESLMTAFSFGDMRLAKFDLIRTAELLKNNDGRMFHTTYSLIWVMMLYDIYQYTGDYKLLEDCEDALLLLLRRFETYVGESHLIENPPDYMFIDWVYLDGISLHHPPKALGQTCLNLFYFGALDRAGSIYEILGKKPMAEVCRNTKEKLRKAINTILYDSEREMYFEGLNTPTPEYRLYEYHPQNVNKRYYRKHANILAAYVGVCSTEKASDLLAKIMSDEIEGEYQPYFAHFLLEAIERNGLRDVYTKQVLAKWKQPIRECAKGLVEGFLPPEPTYQFDHSHAWGGTPLYALPKAILGLEILEPGLKKLRIRPSRLGFQKVHVELPTPYGTVVLDMEEGKENQLVSPQEITVIVG